MKTRRGVDMMRSGYPASVQPAFDAFLGKVDALVDGADDSVVVERIIDTYVRRLRRTFESIDAEFDRIETIVGAGYRWRDS